MIGKLEDGRQITDVTKFIMLRLLLLFPGFGDHFKELGNRGRFCSTISTEYKYIAIFTKIYRALQLLMGQISFLLENTNRLKKAVARLLQQEGLYVRLPIVFVPSSRFHSRARFNGVISIAIGSRTIGLVVCYQVRVGSVCHMIVDG